MTVVVALTKCDVLWARPAQTPADAKLFIYDDILRQLNETCGEEGLTVKLTKDGYGEPVITTTDEYGCSTMYKEMDGSRGVHQEYPLDKERMNDNA